MNCSYAIVLLLILTIVLNTFFECIADALGSEKESFFKEMKMMKMVSSADNEMKKFVVNMVGCITVKEPLLLVVEFVKHGDLQTFLRTIKKQVLIVVFALLIIDVGSRIFY